MDKSNPAVGAVVYSSYFTGSWRVLDTHSNTPNRINCHLKSPGILPKIPNYGNTAVLMHTDTKAVLQAIQRKDLKENSLLMPSIVACLEIHKVQKDAVILN